MDEVKAQAQKLLAVLRNNKPEDRSETARRFAIAITDAEKLYAWIETWLPTPDEDRRSDND